MQKFGIINAQTRSLLARCGHRDRLAIVDAGYNIPLGVEIVDLAFLPNIPTILQVLDGVLAEFSVEQLIVAEEITTYAPELLVEYQKRATAASPLVFVPHSTLDAEMRAVKGVLRTGNYGLHAPNIILQGGCTYD